MATNEKLKILIVDDHDIVRKGLAMLVSRQEDLFVVAEAGTVVEAVKKARESVPDVVVMDIRLCHRLKISTVGPAVVMSWILILKILKRKLPGKDGKKN